MACWTRAGLPQCAGDRAAAARRRHQHRSPAGAEEARQAVPVRRPRRHPLRGAARRGRGRARRGHGQGPAPRRQFEVAAGGAGRGAAGRAASSNARMQETLTMKPIRLDGQFADARAAGRRRAMARRSSWTRRSCSRCSAPPISWPSRSRREEPIYGVSTGFGSNADKLLGAHPPARRLAGREARRTRRLLRGTAAQPDRHPCGLRRRTVRRRSGARDAGASASTP